MSPIRPSEKARYPKDWRAISTRIKARAGDQCECWGECGHERHSSKYRCPELQGQPAARFRGRVILTVAHLDHTPENCADANLKAMCQLCHLSYDRAVHAANARATREARDPQIKLFPLEAPR